MGIKIKSVVNDSNNNTDFRRNSHGGTKIAVFTNTVVCKNSVGHENIKLVKLITQLYVQSLKVNLTSAKHIFESNFLKH